jgi:hypothetical protein
VATAPYEIVNGAFSRRSTARLIARILPLGTVIVPAALRTVAWRRHGGTAAHHTLAL